MYPRLLAIIIFLECFIFVEAQEVFTASYFDVYGPLRDISPVTPGTIDHKKWKDYIVPNQFGETEYNNADNALPMDGDPVIQDFNGSKNLGRGINLSFPGIRNSDNSGRVSPPDTDGDAGLSHYMQMANLVFEVFDKNGNSLYGPADNITLWNGFPGPWSSTNDGDPIVLYDEVADRWLATQFSLPNYPDGPYYELIAVSASGDPTGIWYRYAFQFDYFPDYPKFGVWPDGYYMALNSPGSDVIVFERDSLLAGSPYARGIGFKNPDRPFSGFHCLLPADCDGPFPPHGTPHYFFTINDDGWSGGNDEIRIWEFRVDWNDPGNSNLNLVQQMVVSPFDSQFTSDIRQPGTSVRLDPISESLMYRSQYRNFGNYAAVVLNHTVDVATNQAGIRWYELRKYCDNAWILYQEGTYSPDNHNRWMGSIAMNGNGDIALGYSVSSNSVKPSIRYTGRNADDPPGIMNISETAIVNGSYSQTDNTRWGDYSMMSVDPSDDYSFWYTNEFVGNYSGSFKWITRIASFDLGNSGPLADFLVCEDTICVESEIELLDISSGSPDTWSWNINPGTYRFVNGTSSSSQNPMVLFDSPGTYDVQLTADNGFGTDVETKTSFITVLGDHADFYATKLNLTVNIEATAFIYNGGCPGGSFLWRFGEGAIPDSAVGPGPHIVKYSSQGLKTVKLIRDDTVSETKLDYIDVHSCEVIQVTINADYYGTETTWDIIDLSDNSKVITGGPYSNGSYEIDVQEICLDRGCYRFRIFDSYGDGICCSYGYGDYAVINITRDRLLGSGGAFSYGDSLDFCIRIPGLWTGDAITGSATDFNNSGNWDDGLLPDLTKDIQIPSGLTYYPVLDGNGSCANLMLENGATFTIDPGSQLEVYKNLFLGEGTSGQVIMNGGVVNIGKTIYLGEGSLLDVDSGILREN